MKREKEARGLLNNTVVNASRDRSSVPERKMLENCEKTCCDATNARESHKSDVEQSSLKRNHPDELVHHGTMIVHRRR